MKTIILKSLTLINFRGEQNRTTEFDERETFVMGDNGLGKSRHFDAFMWLLFGKDANDRKDYEIKTRVNGEQLRHVNCEVSGTLVVDGETIKLRRAFVEDWVKPRGQMEQVFKGHHTECAVNDVPMNVTEYKNNIKAIVDDGLFKMITNPLFFASMPWQKQREQLFALAGTITDEEIAQDNEKYQALLAKLTGKDMEGYRKEIVAKKKKAKAQLDQIQPRIDQTQRLMPVEKDWSVIESEIVELDAKIAEVDRQLQDKSEAIRIAYQSEQDKKAKCTHIVAKQSNVLFKARQEANEIAYKANAARREAALKADEANTAVSSTKRKVDVLESELQTYQSKRKEYTDKMEELRKAWHEQNARTYNGETICPHCGQELPESMKADAEKRFNDTIKAEKDKINVKGKEYKGFVAKVDESVAETEKALQKAKEAYQTAQSEAKAAADNLAKMGEEVKAKEVNPEDVPEWVSLNKELVAIRATISTDTTSVVDNSELNEQKRTLTAERDAKKRDLSERDTIAKHKKAIEELEKEGKKLAQEVASYEKEEFVMNDFTKAKINECEKRINRMFAHVTFKLYDYTLENNPVETCVPLVNGVPFFVANTAAKVNAGLDIINALCKFYNVCAPIFIDGRESVNTLVPTASQIINLVVSHDKEIIVKH